MIDWIKQKIQYYKAMYKADLALWEEYFTGKKDKSLLNNDHDSADHKHDDSGADK